jgi:anaerobic glycerol-3-phosphate dehydrogenase
MATEWDALVLGAGLTGFAAACALAEKGKKVAVIFQDTGATSLSSGSWDLGPPSEGMPLARALESAAWREAYTPLLFEGEAPGKASTLQEDLKAVASAFKETLPMQLSFETPLLLPCLSGGLRHTYCAQEIQAAGNLSAANGKKFALVASRRWRFRADLLCRQWNDRLKKIGSSAEFRAVDLPLEMEGWDIPLSRVCADLAVSEGARVRFQEALGRFNDSVAM